MHQRHVSFVAVAEQVPEGRREASHVLLRKPSRWIVHGTLRVNRNLFWRARVCSSRLFKAENQVDRTDQNRCRVDL